MSATTAALRNGGGAIDTDINSYDFSIGAPNPRNSNYAPPIVAPQVSSTVPENGAIQVVLDANLAVNFSENVTVTDPWFTVSCTTSGVHTVAVNGGPQNFTLDPDANFGINETCTIILVADNIVDQNSTPPAPLTTDYTWSFTTFDANEPAPTVETTTPGKDALDVGVGENLNVTFSEPVDISSGWFSITCSRTGFHAASVTGGPLTYTLDPVNNFLEGDTCTVTLQAGAITDQDSLDPNDQMAADYSWSFSTWIDTNGACLSATLPIHAIQGSGASSPAIDSLRTIEGIVIASYQGPYELEGFFVQDEPDAWDSQPVTSEGIFVYQSTTIVHPGDVVRVTGTVAEYYGLTELNNAMVTVCSTDAPLPAAQELDLPFPAAAGDVPYLERFEGMRVSLPAGLTVTELYTLGRGGEFWLTNGPRLLNPTNVVEPGAPAIAMENANDLNRILVDDHSNKEDADTSENPPVIMHPAPELSASNRVRLGDTTAAPITGVLNYSWSGWYGSENYYRIHADTGATFNVAPRPPETVDNDPYLTVASFNVLNYFNGDGLGGGFPTSRGASNQEEFNRQRTKIINAIHSLDVDVIGLMELENDGFDSTSAIQDLVNGLNNLAGGTDYAFVNPGISPVGGDEITVGILYKPAVVTPTGSATVLTTGAFVQDAANRRHRAPMAQTFTELRSGEKFTVVVNHFKSKGCSAEATGGNADSGDGQGCWNQARTQAAADLIAWVNGDPTSSGDPDFLLVGDFNAYRMEDPVDAFLTAGYADLDSETGEDYSYVFSGQAGRLDHAFASTSLADQIAGAYAHHINADEPAAFDYEDWNQTGLYQEDVYRSSDHDPTLVLLTLAPDAYADTDLDCYAHKPCFSTIQEAVTAVRNNGNVYVYSGDYAQDVSIARSITVHFEEDVAINSYNQSAGAVDGKAAAIMVRGNWIQTGGTFGPGTGTVAFAGSAAQTISNVSAFNNLTMDNTGAGVSLFSDITVNGVLTLNSGWLDLDARNLTLAASASIAGTPTAAAMIVAGGTGTVCKQVNLADPPAFTFPVGDDTGVAEYTPVKVDLSSVSGEGCVFVRLTDAPQPNNTALPRLSRYWTITQSGLSAFTADLTFTYLDADVEVETGQDESQIRAAARHAGTGWQVGDPVDAVNNRFSITVNAFSDFTGTPLAPTAVVMSGLNALRLESGVRVTWNTAMEINLLGFKVYRSTNPLARGELLTPTFIPSAQSGENIGAEYVFLDETASAGITYYYWVEMITTVDTQLIGPALVPWDFNLFLPLIGS